MTKRRPWFLDGVSEFLGFRYAMGSALWEQTTDEEAIATLNVALNYVATAIGSYAIFLPRTELPPLPPEEKRVEFGG